MKDISSIQLQNLNGLSKRDFIAALALPTLMELTNSVRPDRKVTQIAVAWADALLEELGGE